MRRRLLLGIGVLALVVEWGCSPSGHSLVEVKGRVTHGDRPMGGMSVNFRPLPTGGMKSAGPGSYAITDSEGRYVLHTVDGNVPGAVVGQHYVAIGVVRPTGLPDNAVVPPDPRIPNAFRNDSVIVTVPPAGLPNADFDLARY